MALFVLFFLILNNCLIILSGSQTSKNGMLEIKPVTVTAGHNVGFYKVDDTLNLTCTFRNRSVLPDVILEWVVPSKAPNSEYRVTQEAGTNFVVLIIKNLRENDSGDYKCRAVHNGIPFFSSENTVKINVKNKKKECSDVMFQCSAGICIPKRYTCDGFKDCVNGEDESPVFCGTGNPCDNKLMCPDNRCIPFSWCCESYREPNCTAKVKYACCTHVEKLTRDVDSDLGYHQYEQHRFTDIGFLQTTVYTVIGCAMAFMFIVTIIVIAICRVHVRRSLLTRCPAASRNLAVRRGGHLQGNHLNGMYIYDLDTCFTGPGLSGNDVMSVNPLLVTYNINNGVQFVGRPIDPPPYCEIVTSPPKEGPPPPYASQENLFSGREDKVEEGRPKGGELVEVCSEAEVTESDALLGATAQSISVISCSAIDVAVPVMEVPSSENSDPPDAGENRTADMKNTYKIFSDAEISELSSQTDAGRSVVDESKSSGLGIVVLKNREPVIADTEGNVKIYNGESSSYLSGSASDISKGAVKKTVSTKSLDPIKKNKNNSKSH